MEPHEIQQLFDYHYWAHGHIVGHLAALSPEQITAHSNRFYYETAFLTLRHTSEKTLDQNEIAQSI